MLFSEYQFWTAVMVYLKIPLGNCYGHFVFICFVNQIFTFFLGNFKFKCVYCHFKYRMYNILTNIIHTGEKSTIKNEDRTTKTDCTVDRSRIYCVFLDVCICILKQSVERLGNKAGGDMGNRIGDFKITAS